jgi:isomerase DpgB
MVSPIVKTSKATKTSESSRASESADTALLTLHLPTGVLRLSKLHEWLAECLESVSTHPQCEGVLIHVEGVSGAPTGGETIAEVSRWEKAVRRLESLPVPVVGAVMDSVGGAALNLLLALDLVVVAPHVMLSCREPVAGMLPGMTLYRLAKYTGLGHAKHILFTGRPIPASEALRLGLVADVSAEPVKTAGALLAEAPARGTAAWQLSRRLLGESYWNSPEDALGCVLAAQDRVLREMGDRR